MDKRNVIIAALIIAFLVTLAALISTSATLDRVVAEKDHFAEKIKDTDKLIAELSSNIEDLKVILGRVEEEKQEVDKKKSF